MHSLRFYKEHKDRHRFIHIIYNRCFRYRRIMKSDAILYITCVEGVDIGLNHVIRWIVVRGRLSYFELMRWIVERTSRKGMRNLRKTKKKKERLLYQKKIEKIIVP